MTDIDRKIDLVLLKLDDRRNDALSLKINIWASVAVVIAAMLFLVVSLVRHLLA